jgi:hypothetical protein
MKKEKVKGKKEKVKHEPRIFYFLPFYFYLFT